MRKKKKSIDEKLRMLELGLNALRNANEHFHETGDPSYILTVQSQLRGLVAMGGKSMSPLLINLSEELEIRLEFYSLTSTNNKTSFSTVFGKVWSPFPEKGLKKIILKDWLLIEDYYANGSKQFKNRNQIIKDASNFEGGTHYLDETPHVVDSLKSENYGSIDNLTATLLGIGEVVYYLGYLLILQKKLTNIKELKVISKIEQDKRIHDISRVIEQHKMNFSNNWGPHGIITS